MDLTSSRHALVGSVIVTMLVSTALGIRVDWNTNTGPITPAQPAPQPVAQPPYREPAPVWEDQSNDIPNPDPYRYVPPPPSRPRQIENTGFQLPNPTNQVAYNNQYNSINPISNEIPNDVPNNNNNKLSYYVEYVPKYFKVGGKHDTDVYTAKYYSKYQKYNIIAYKDKYHNVPYYVFFFARDPNYNWRQ